MEKAKVNFQFFLDHKKELVSKYGGMYIVIVNCEVVGSYADDNVAYEEAVEKYGLGNFIIQLCTEDDEAYVQTFHSRVAFA